MIIDGRKIQKEILVEIKEGIDALPFVPVFCDILVGSDPVSAQYVRMKARVAESVGIKFRTADFGDDATTESIIEEIENLNRVPHMCGIIVQLPLPSHIDQNKVLDAIAPDLDVDCLGSFASNEFYSNKETLGYPTALACMKIIDSLGIDLSSKKILVLGQGKLVGRPVTHLLRTRNFDVATASAATSNTDELLKDADIIISAIGQGKFITGDMIRHDVIIIDAGTSEENGAVVGDVDFESVKDVASYISPTPGGVGPVTIGVLLSNVLHVARQKIHE